MARRIVFPAPGVVELQDFDLPRVGAADVAIRTELSLMSIGTETTILTANYAADSHFARIFSFPQLKTGVQAIGRVVDTGADVAGFAPGDRVYMRMAHGSHQVLPADALSAVPMDAKLPDACWCGLAKTAFRAAWAAPFRYGTSVLIVGAGPVGQMAIRWAAAAGVAELAVADLSPLRLDLARRGGAQRTLAGELAENSAAIGAMNDGNGPAVIVDTTGNPAVFRTALAVAGRFARIVLLGDTGYPDRQHLSSDMMTKGLTVLATHDSHDVDGWDQRRIDALFFESLTSGRFPVDGLITHEFSPVDCKEAYALALERRAEILGVLFDWRDAEFD